MASKTATSTTGFEITPEFVAAIRGALGKVVTQSEIMTRANCPRKWFYRYALSLKHRGTFNWHFLYGDLLHKMLADFYTNKKARLASAKVEPSKIEFPDDVLPTQLDREEAELLEKVAGITFSNYCLYYEKMDARMRVRSVERVYKVKYKGLQLEGRIDLVAHPSDEDGMFVYDYKTTGSFNPGMLDAWSFRFQFLFYSWLVWRATGRKPDGNYVNGILKTLLRPKQIDRKTKEIESPKEFLSRVDYDMQVNRERYFYRVRMPLAEGMLERFQKDILDPHISNFVMLTKATSDTRRVPLKKIISAIGMAMNTDECHKYNSFCEFLSLCKDGQMMLPEYITREVKHEELCQQKN